MASSNPPPPPATVPYDHLFKVLMIGDAGVGKVCSKFKCNVSLLAFISTGHVLNFLHAISLPCCYDSQMTPSTNTSNLP
jgi:hypothetical protein